jgi:hypothetical protein
MEEIYEMYTFVQILWTVAELEGNVGGGRKTVLKKIMGAKNI